MKSKQKAVLLIVLAVAFTLHVTIFPLLLPTLFTGSVRRESVTASVRNSQLPPCPDKPPFLLGFTEAIEEVDKPMTQLEAELGPLLRHGGHYSPPNCRPENRTAIIIPCRNRWPHLRVLLNHLVPVLIRQQLDFTIFVVESDQAGTFNKGVLLNVGVLEAMKRGRYTCFVVQDVDLLTMDDRNLYRCAATPRHLAVAINKNHYHLPYPQYSGGVYALSLEQLLKVNGHSNMFFGWGGEDDDIRIRLKAVGNNFTRNLITRAKYWMIKHQRPDKGNTRTTQSDILKRKEQVVKRMFEEGLNTTRYHLDSVLETPLFTWIRVTINQTEVVQSAPSYVQDLYRSGLTFRSFKN